MKELRRRQRLLYSIMKVSVIIGAVVLFVYIGAKPYIIDYSVVADKVCNYICDGMVVAVLILLFIYYSKYGKCESFLSSVENELTDTGYYYTARTESEAEKYISSIYDDLDQCNYSMNKNLEINELDFDIKAEKRNEYFYCVAVDDIDRNDVLAYLDSVIYDITVRNLKKKGNAVICFVTNKAQEDAIALSKMITPLGKKEQIKIAISIVELSTRRVYFLGNVKTKCQQLVVNFAMNCELPLKEQYIGKERLPFQDALEEKMKEFTIKEFKAGNFSVH